MYHVLNVNLKLLSMNTAKGLDCVLHGTASASSGGVSCECSNQQPKPTESEKRGTNWASVSVRVSNEGTNQFRMGVQLIY